MRHRKSVRVAESALGHAVFAQKSFTAETRLGRITGEVVSDSEYGSDYCMEFGDGRVLEPDPPFRYLNHSCEPNCELVIWEYDDPSDWQMHLYATRRINAGDELTIDYAWDVGNLIPCACGSKTCRGWIVAAAPKGQVESAAEVAG